VAYWIKILHERNTYIVDLDSLSAFCIGINQRIQFWLPESGQPIIISLSSNPEAYHQIVEYIKGTTTQPLTKYWVTIGYQRHQYVIDLNQVHSFTCDCSQRITFCIPHSQESIIINPQSNPKDYYKIQDYIHRTTGFSLP
jgi:hypothetical protein